MKREKAALVKSKTFNALALTEEEAAKSTQPLTRAIRARLHGLGGAASGGAGGGGAGGGAGGGGEDSCAGSSFGGLPAGIALLV